MPFTKGQSGNPKGRRVGSINKCTKHLLEVLNPQGEALVSRLIELALAGDIGALRLCMDRLLPTLKPCELPVSLPDLPESLTDQGKAILKVMASGALTPSQAAALLTALGSQAKLVELDILKARLQALELTLKSREKTP